MNRLAPVAGLALTALIVLSGCGAVSGGATSSPSQSAETPSAPSASADPAPGALDARAAAEAAAAEAPGIVVELGLGRQRGRAVWEVGVLAADGSGIELYLAVDDGSVLSRGTYRLSSEQTTAPSISAVDAIDLALEAAPGSVVELDLGTERGVIVWEALIASRTSGLFEIYLDAQNGDVVKNERAS